MFLGSTAEEGGEVIEVDTEADIVVGTGTAPIEHVAGEFLIIHSVYRAQAVTEGADVDINQHA
jgi:hypothetical protein